MKHSKEVIPENKWWCETCKSEEMTFDQMKSHIQQAHGCDPKTTKAKRSMVMHMDGDTWFSSQYEVTIQASTGEIKLTNSTLNSRHQHDPMRDCS